MNARHRFALGLILMCYCDDLLAQSYVQCYYVISRIKREFTPDLKFVTSSVFEKGKPMGDRFPISESMHVLNSTELYRKYALEGYAENTVCEYHFIVTRVSALKFNKIHLDQSSGVLVSYDECKRATHPERRDRDYIELDVEFASGRSNVFWGQPNRHVHRLIRPKDLPVVGGQRELVITFWSDGSLVGHGFYGYFYDDRIKNNHLHN